MQVSGGSVFFFFFFAESEQKMQVKALRFRVFPPVVHSACLIDAEVSLEMNNGVAGAERDWARPLKKLSLKVALGSGWRPLLKSPARRRWRLVSRLFKAAGSTSDLAADDLSRVPTI